MVAPGDVIATIEGPARGLLTGERTALNFLCHLSGVATATASLVSAAQGTKARIVCTRKTTPGLRALEKYAVRAGGGSNHRFGLDDAVLIKDNHIALAGDIRTAIERAKAHAGHLVKIEVEVDTLSQLEQVLAIGVDAVLLDNMTVEAAAAGGGDDGRPRDHGGLRPHHRRDRQGDRRDRRRPDFGRLADAQLRRARYRARLSGIQFGRELTRATRVERKELLGRANRGLFFLAHQPVVALDHRIGRERKQDHQ